MKEICLLKCPLAQNQIILLEIHIFLKFHKYSQMQSVQTFSENISFENIILNSIVQNTLQF